MKEKSITQTDVKFLVFVAVNAIALASFFFSLKMEIALVQKDIRSLLQYSKEYSEKIQSHENRLTVLEIKDEQN